MLNTVVIGCGTVVEELYTLPLKRLVNAGALRLVGLVDRDKARLQRLGGKLSCSKHFNDLSACFAAGSVDLVIITSPARLHAEHAEISVEHGAHVFCEKPLAQSPQEVNRMADAAFRCKRSIGVGMARRFYPNLAEVRERLVSGELPGPVRFSLVEGGPYGWPIASDAAFRRPPDGSGGGVLLDVGAHTLDTLAWLFGVPRVLSCADDAMGAGVEANVRVDLSFPKAIGCLQLSWDQPLNSALKISGPGWEVRLSNLEIVRYEERLNGGDWRWRKSAVRWPSNTKPGAPVMGQPECYYDCFDYQLVGFIRSILYGESLAVTCTDAAVVLEAIKEAYSMTRPLDLPWLGPDEATALAGGHWRNGR